MAGCCSRQPVPSVPIPLATHGQRATPLAGTPLRHKHDWISASLKAGAPPRSSDTGEKRALDWLLGPPVRSGCSRLKEPPRPTTGCAPTVSAAISPSDSPAQAMPMYGLTCVDELVFPAGGDKQVADPGRSDTCSCAGAGIAPVTVPDGLLGEASALIPLAGLLARSRLVTELTTPRSERGAEPGRVRSGCPSR